MNELVASSRLILHKQLISMVNCLDKTMATAAVYKTLDVRSEYLHVYLRHAIYPLIRDVTDIYTFEHVILQTHLVSFDRLID